jgi:hypothetical protein
MDDSSPRAPGLPKLSLFRVLQEDPVMRVSVTPNMIQSASSGRFSFFFFFHEINA